MRRFWAAIASGLASEEAAATADVPQAVGARWFRKAGGMRPAMFGPSASRIQADIFRLPNARRSRSCERKAALIRGGGASDRTCGVNGLSGVASKRSHSQRRNGRIAQRQRNGMPSDQLADQSKQSLCWNAALQAYVQDRLSGWSKLRAAFLFRPGRILERATTRSAAASPMGACLEP